MGAILVYDIAKVTSFQNLDKWIEELKQHTDSNLSVIIVGNKSDLKHLRIVETKRGRQYATDHNMLFMETSALDSTNVTEAFEDLVTHIYEGVKKREDEKKSRTLLSLSVDHLAHTQNGTNGSVNIAKLAAERQSVKPKSNRFPCCAT